MLTEKDTIKCEAVFNDNRTHRYLCKRVWNKDKPCIAVIMLNPCSSDNIINDTTTSLVINNVARLEEYGGVHILNLYSIMTTKLDFKHHTDEQLNDKENDSYIVKSAQECSKIVLAWGKAQDTNQRIADRVVKILNLLLPYADKLCCISDGERKMRHPLTPSVRAKWNLEKIDLPQSNQDK